MSTWSDPPDSLPLPELAARRAAYLYTEHVGVTGNDERAALQMAIWEVLYDVDLSVSLTTGRFYVDPDAPLERYATIAGIADGYLTGLATNPAVATADATWLQLSFGPVGNERNIQDFIGPAASSPNPNPVPEPSAGLLLGMGISAVAAFRTRKSLFRRG